MTTMHKGPEDLWLCGPCRDQYHVALRALRDMDKFAMSILVGCISSHN